MEPTRQGHTARCCSNCLLQRSLLLASRARVRCRSCGCTRHQEKHVQAGAGQARACMLGAAGEGEGLPAGVGLPSHEVPRSCCGSPSKCLAQALPSRSHIEPGTDRMVLACLLQKRQAADVLALIQSCRS